MKYSLSENSIFPIVEISLEQGSSIQLERGCMVYHTPTVELTAQMNGNGSTGVTGFIKAVGRSSSSGESFFISKAEGTGPDARIAIAPATPGKIQELQIGEIQWRLNTGAYLASDIGVSYDMKRQKIAKAILGGTGGLFVMETKGEGTMLINSYGDIIELEITPDKPLIIDNQHVVAWSTELDYQIRVASGVFGFKTGEGVVNEFHGSGKVLIQTRNLQSLASQIAISGTI